MKPNDHGICQSIAVCRNMSFNEHCLVVKKPIPADNFKKYSTKHNPKISILKPEI